MLRSSEYREKKLSLEWKDDTCTVSGEYWQQIHMQIKLLFINGSLLIAFQQILVSEFLIHAVLHTYGNIAYLIFTVPQKIITEYKRIFVLN